MIWLLSILALAVIADAFMDFILFQRPHDSGFWSLHWNDTNDSWHYCKKLKWFFICLAIKPDIIFLIICSFIILIFHEVFYHLIFKKLKIF